LVLRLEDLDTTRLRAGQRELMVEALSWLGLDWDELHVQSEFTAQHEAALDILAASEQLYPCSCSRKEWRARGRVAPDGGVAYDNRCRGRDFGEGGWRASADALRVQLPDSRVELLDESGLDLGQTPATEMGDPVVRRRDGVIAYHLVVVVDDAACSVDRVVRGRDLASSTATQVQLQALLNLPRPDYRHHFLLLEDRDTKLAKFHGSMPYEELIQSTTGPALCGELARIAGLHEGGELRPQELLPDFDWRRVRTEDLLYEGPGASS
jgi:glutamyl-tRNA synthetase/glutamyl-Q tRNA(Asp) synthetase